jgi:hypothetical protein
MKDRQNESKQSKSERDRGRQAQRNEKVGEDRKGVKE